MINPLFSTNIYKTKFNNIKKLESKNRDLLLEINALEIRDKESKNIIKIDSIKIGELKHSESNLTTELTRLKAELDECTESECNIWILIEKNMLQKDLENAKSLIKKLLTKFPKTQYILKCNEYLRAIQDAENRKEQITNLNRKLSK